MRQYGLIGYALQHSFSKQFFAEKFEREHLANCSYDNFELKTIDEFPKLIVAHPNFCGLNVTVPYKQSIINYLSGIDDEARDIGAVNVIKFSKADNKSILTGYNTDHYGFGKALKEASPTPSLTALILGMGGSSKAVAYALKNMNIKYTIVSRQPIAGQLLFSDLTSEIINANRLIINTTPLGMYPQVETYPPLPYHSLTNKHILFDLTYNPAETVFLKKGKEKGAKTINGLKMLHYQAERSWEIWNAD